MKLYEQKIALLGEIADEIRKTTIELIQASRVSHGKNAFEFAEIFAVLYSYALQHNPERPAWEDRDRLILSDRAATPAYYTALSYAGYFTRDVLFSWRTNKSNAPYSNPVKNIQMGIEGTTRGNGMSLAEAIGVSLAARLDGQTSKTYCVLSDEEHSSGALWEAVLFAGNKKITNCVAIINRNGLQNSGKTECDFPLESLRAKYEAFNWQVLEVDGHNIEALIAAVREANETHEKPTAIIAHTTSSHGFEFSKKSAKK